MKIFQCSHCSHPVFFENTYCERCGQSLGYLDTTDEIYALAPGNEQWHVDEQTYGYCKNHVHHVCNWLVPTESTEGYCTACRLNRTIPDLSVPENYERWKKLEIAKHRLVYSLLKLPLPVESRLDQPETGLCFDFLSAKVPGPAGQQIMTGHANGVITIILAEADSVKREQIRRSLNEPYRTLIGHFRHEVGHFYWQRIVAEDEALLTSFRSLFGDERRSYSEALATHYTTGPSKDWRDSFISEYAASHPWEDWAETWAHYLHIINAMETAYQFGLEVNPKLQNAPHMRLQSYNPYDELPFQTILDESIALFYAVNSINRSMGIPDVYPFIISNPVVKKLEYIHQMMQGLKKTP